MWEPHAVKLLYFPRGIRMAKKYTVKEIHILMIIHKILESQ